MTDRELLHALQGSMDNLHKKVDGLLAFERHARDQYIPRKECRENRRDCLKGGQPGEQQPKADARNGDRVQQQIQSGLVDVIKILAGALLALAGFQVVG